MSHRSEIEAVFTRTINRYDALIRRICFAYSTSATSAEDLYQEAMASLWLGLKTFKGQSALSTWIYRVTLNSCISFLRRNDSRNFYTVPAQDVDLEDDNHDWGNDEYACLQYLISLLNPMDKALLLMWLDELSYTEIADVTGLKTNVIGTRLTRIRRQLQKMWEKEQNSYKNQFDYGKSE